MNDLKLTAAILSLIEIVAWIAVVSTAPLAFLLFEVLARNTAIIGVIGYFLSALAYVALIRTGRAIVVIAQNTSLQKPGETKRPERKPPTMSTNPGRGKEPPIR